ncbi:MAG: Bifunctional protein HldE, partial [Candidatus Woesebacteria bacterium GW2011_GWE2_31_6]
MTVENPFFGKLHNLDEIADEVSKKKSSGKKVGLITGCFDILHVGHIDLFRKAKEHV